MADQVFKLKKTRGVLSHSNERTEKHGDDRALAKDLTVKVSLPSDFLATLSPPIKWASCWDNEGEVYDDLGVTSFPFNMTYVGHKASIGVNGKEAMFNDVRIRQLRAWLKSGNRIELKFQLQVHPKDNQLSVIAEGLRAGDISVKIEPQRDAGVERETDGQTRELNLPDPGNEPPASAHE